MLTPNLIIFSSWPAGQIKNRLNIITHVTHKTNWLRTTYILSTADHYLVEEKNVYISSNLPNSFGDFKRGLDKMVREKSRF